MGRTKKDYIPLNIKLRKDISESLEEYAEESMHTKTDVVEKAVLAYLKEQARNKKNLEKVKNA